MKNMETWGLMHVVDLVKPRVLYMAVDNVTECTWEPNSDNLKKQQ